MTLKYRAEIDGLRAIAVLSVIFFHAGFELFRGGYVGVDIFFVISGFLITSIILGEVESKSFSILNFYERRARRILPALFFMMFLCVPAAWLVFEAKDLESFFRSLNAIPTFTANIFFWKDVEYFATASELKPLIHTWSLAVEEQYYILFPILFLFLKGRKYRNIIFILLVGLAIFSLVYAELLSSRDASKNFFLLPTRFWEISLGAFIAFLPSSAFNINDKKKQYLSFLGLSLVFASIFIFTKDTPVPSIYALIPTLGTALIIMYASENTVVGRVLSCKAIVGIGLISYSAYLWHQPIFSFSRYYTGRNVLGSGFTWFLIFLSLLFAWFTWRFIEAPFKNRALFKRQFIFNSSILLSLFFVSFGFVFSESFKDYAADEKTALLLKTHPVVYFTGIRNEAIFMEKFIDAQVINPEIVVIGSSRVMQVRSPDQKKLLNLGVSGSALRDDIGMLYFVDRKLSPNTVIIGADPWLLSSQLEDGRYKNLENAYFLSTGKSQVEDIRETRFSFLKNVITRNYDHTTYSVRIPENDLPEIKAKKRNDGSHVYDSVYTLKSQREIESGFGDIMKYKVLGGSSDAKEYMKNEASVIEFRKLVEQQRRKRNVVLVLSPYHPKLFIRIRKELPIFLDIEKEFRKIAKDHNIKVVGSYDPGIAGCSAEEFYDGMHPKELCMRKIVKMIF